MKTLTYDLSLYLGSYWVDGINGVLFHPDDTSHKLLRILWQLNPKNFDSVVLNKGPGSFTGLRVNLAIALGLYAFKSFKLYSFSLRELANHLKHGIIFRITKNDFGVIHSNGDYSFVKLHELPALDIGKLKFQIYCDDFRDLKKLEKLPNMSLLIMENQHLWIEEEISTSSLDYGLEVEYRKRKLVI